MDGPMIEAGGKQGGDGMRPDTDQAHYPEGRTGNTPVKPATVRDTSWPKGRKATDDEIEATAAWYFGLGYAVRASKGGCLVDVQVSQGTAIRDYVGIVGVVGHPSDVAAGLLALRATEWKGARVGGAWKQQDLDRFHSAAARVGLDVEYADGLAPSTAATESVTAERDNKGTVLDDARDGAELLAIYEGGHSDNPQLRAFAFAFPEAGAELRGMLPLELAATARVARVEGQRLLDENPDSASVIEKVRDVGQDNAAKADGQPPKFIPGGNGGI